MRFLKESLSDTLVGKRCLRHYSKLLPQYGPFKGLHGRSRYASFNGFGGTTSLTITQRKQKGCYPTTRIGHLFYQNRKPSIQGVIESNEY